MGTFSAPKSEKNSSTATAFDTSSDQKFVDYYAKESLSEATGIRFETVRRKVLKLARQGGLKEPLDVSDIGCGAGTQSLIWARGGARVWGVDINEALIRIARERARDSNLQIQFEVGSATALPYPSESIDICLLPELLEHISAWEIGLDEAIRILRRQGILFLSTTNWLCPKQQEFNLPLYSWYPPPLKRYFETLASSSHPQIANYAKYPAVNWFTYYGLSRFLRERGMRCFDRFDMIENSSMTGQQKAIVRLVRRSPLLRFLGHVSTPGTTIFAVKVSGRRNLDGSS